MTIQENSKIIVLRNQEFAAQINTYGGEVMSICKGGREYLWQGKDERYWTGHSPLLFPIVGHLENEMIKIRGMQCKMENHGFLQNIILDVEKQTETELVLSTAYTEETLKCYPFKFRFTVTYRVTENTLEIEYLIENLDEEEMVYNFGLHPGFNCNINEGEGIENYYLEFPEPKTLETVVFNDDIRVELDRTKTIVEDSKFFEFQDELFERTIIIRDIDFDKIWLGHKEKGRIFEFSYEGFNTLALYRGQGAPFICLEPWTGSDAIVQDFENLEENPTIQFMPAGECRLFKMKVDLHND